MPPIIRFLLVRPPGLPHADVFAGTIYVQPGPPNSCSLTSSILVRDFIKADKPWSSDADWCAQSVATDLDVVEAGGLFPTPPSGTRPQIGHAAPQGRQGPGSARFWPYGWPGVSRTHFLVRLFYGCSCMFTCPAITVSRDRYVKGS